MRACFKITILMLFIAAGSCAAAFQGGERPVPTPPTGTATKSTRPHMPVRTRARSKDSDSAKFANLNISVTPSDSAVWVNDQKITQAPSDGRISLTNLKPGLCVLIVRREGFSEQTMSVELNAGPNEPINVVLQPLKGTLVVRPNVDGTAIELRSVNRDQNVGSYAGAIEGIDFPPGDYELTVSKPGYKSKTRTFTLKAGSLVELEPVIEPLPAPTPTPQNIIPTQSSVSVDGKYLLVGITGSSGQVARTAGTLDVTINKTSQSAYVQGSFSGAACEITFTPLENIDQWALTTVPAPANGWALFGARIRPKDLKRPARFLINWVAKQEAVNTPAENSPASDSSPTSTRAIPVHREVPSVPPMARAGRVKGLVKVTVVIDEEGNVKSAKAIDGPVMLRVAAENAARGWRFKPATRNGLPVASTETIHFTFEGY